MKELTEKENADIKNILFALRSVIYMSESMGYHICIGGKKIDDGAVDVYCDSHHPKCIFIDSNIEFHKRFTHES